MAFPEHSEKDKSGKAATFAYIQVNIWDTVIMLDMFDLNEANGVSICVGRMACTFDGEE